MFFSRRLSSICNPFKYIRTQKPHLKSIVQSIYVITIIAFFNNLNAQEPSAAATPTVVIEGQVALTTNGKGVYLNLGGPGVRFTFANFALGFNLMPTLRFQKEEPKSFVTPLLGFGPQLYLPKSKRLVLSLPLYYNTTKNRWLLTAGLGYLFTKPKIN